MKKQPSRRYRKLHFVLLGSAAVVIIGGLLCWLWLPHTNKAQDQATAEDLFTLQTAIDNQPDVQSLQNLSVALKRPLSTYTFTNTTERGAPSRTYTLCGVFTSRQGLANLPVGERTPRLGNGTTNVYTAHGQGTQCYQVADTPKGKWVNIQLHHEDVRLPATVKTDFVQFTATASSTYQGHMQVLGALGTEHDLQKNCVVVSDEHKIYHCGIHVSRKLPSISTEQSKAGLDALTAKLKAQGFNADKQEGTKMRHDDGTIEMLDNIISVTGTTTDCSVVAVFNPDNSAVGTSYDYTCWAPYSATAPKDFGIAAHQPLQL